MSGPPLPFATVCAFLEECGYRRKRIRRLTRGYVRDVLRHARDERGRLEMPASADAPSYEDRLRRILFRRNCPAWAVERKVRDIVESQPKEG